MTHSWQPTNKKLGRCSCGWPFQVGQVREYTHQKHAESINRNLKSAKKYLAKAVDKPRLDADIVSK